MIKNLLIRPYSYDIKHQCELAHTVVYSFFFRSAYFLFSNQNRETVKNELIAKGREVKITDVASALGERWRGMTDKEKEPFEELAAKDKKRYQREMAEWNSR